MNRFYKSLAIPALIAGSSLGLTAQNVGIGTNAPNTSAKLHIVDANRGILIPQVSIGDINLPAPVATPATGLLVWNTNATIVGGGGEGFYYWSGTLWTRLSTNSGTDNQNLTSATLLGNNLTINIEDGASTVVDLSALVNDADFVIGNEYNTGATLTGTNLNVIDGGGATTVNLAALVNDADFVIGNEYNTAFSLTGTNLRVTDGGGARTVNLASLVNDADFVIGNEYNTGATLTGTNLNVIDGGGATTVNLAALVNDADFVIGNEYNTGANLSGTNLRIIDGGGTRTVNLASLVNDADFVIGNEYNTGANLSGTTLNIIDGGGTRAVNLAALSRNAENGLYVNGGNNSIRLGGPLIQNTTITQGAFSMIYNLNGTGDFLIRDNGVNHFSVVDNGDAHFGSDVYWRDENTGGTILAQMIDDGDDGRFIIRENGATSVDLDANTQFIFNEQGLDRDFRVESDIDPNVFRVNAGTNRVGIGEANPTTRLEVTAADGQTLMLSRQDGAITGNEQLGGIGFDGSDGNTPDDIRESSAAIIAFASEDHSTGDKGGRLTFWTSPTNQDDDTDGFERLRIDQDGNHYVGGDMYWRDASVTGTNLARIVDDGNDGQMIIYEDGITQILLDANGTSVFNERGLDRDFRIESDGDANNFFINAGTNRVGIGTGAPAQKLHVVGTTRISTLAGAGNRMVVANANGDLLTQAIPANGDITGVNAGAGITGGGAAGTVTLTAAANNGLYVNAGADRIRLGGGLVENTTITQGIYSMIYNLNNTGDFLVQDNGTTQFAVQDNGDVRADNATFYVDASTDRVGIGTTAPGDKLHVVGDILLTGGTRNIEIQAGDQNIQMDDSNPTWNGNTYGGVTRFFGDGTLASSKLEAGGLQLERRIQIRGGNPAAGRVLTSDAAGNATWVAPTVGDITSVAAGAGLVGGGTAGNVTLNASANNGLYVNVGADRIRLGGNLIETTVITQNAFPMRFNLNGTGDFDIQDNGVNKFSVVDNGISLFGDDVYFRDASTIGTNLVVIEDDANDGRLRVMENGITSVDLDANTHFIFNEQGLNRDFRVESDGNPNMLFLDASLNRVSVGTGASGGTFNVQGTSFHSNDIYLRDGAVNTGDVLVRIFDSNDDGIIDVYENNGINHRIHGNGTSVFNEQGNNNADIRMESDTRTNMFWLDANENIVRFGTASTVSDWGNGTTVGGTVVDYVADFDRGIGATGTAIGIGSVEYLLDNSSETSINNAFSPTTHINRDLGFSTTLRGWDDVYADNFVNISDLREKKDIAELTYGLEEVLKMRPVSYILKRDPFGDRKLGLIAQEALVLVPEAVKTHDNKILDESKPEEYTRIELDRMGMTYQQLIPVLIKATQEQQAQIEALKEEIKALKK